MRTAGTLHERDSELAWLSEQIDGALAGGGAATAIEGEAGIGKSALLEVAARRAQDAGLRVLRARGAELERDFPYGVARQLFEPVLLAASPPERERLTAGPAGLAGEALTLSEPAGPVAGDRGPAVAHGLYWLAANLAAEQPVMLALDDAHWADAASLRSIAYLARRVEGMPLLMVWTLRPPEGAPDEARPPEPDTVLQPAPLSEAAAGAVVGEQLGEQRSGAFVRACHTATGGNPFLLHELLRAVGEQEGAGQEQLPSVAPATIRRATAARLRRLGLDEERLATSVAVLGGRARHRHAAALAGLAPDAATDAADRLAGAEILRDGRPLDFVHPIVLAAVREALAPGRRAQLHRSAAEILAADDAEPEVIATHLLATEPGGDAWTVERLRAAAGLALARGVPELASAYLERALAESPLAPTRSAVLQEAGVAAFLAGRPGPAVERLRSAFDTAPDLAAQAAAAPLLGVALTAVNRSEEAVAVLGRVIPQVARRDPETAMRMDADLIGCAQIELATAGAARERLALYDPRLPGETAGERLILSGFAMQTMLAGDSADRAAELAERALGGGRLLVEQRPDAHAFYQATITLTSADRLEQAGEMLELAIADARARGSALGFAIASACRSHVLLRQGQVTRAEAEGVAAFEAIDPDGWPGPLPMLVAYLLDALLERGTPAAREALLATGGLHGSPPPVTLANPLLHSRGHHRLSIGDPAGALADFRDLRRRDAQWGMDNPGPWPTLGSTALALTALGQREQALALAHEELERARRWGAPGALAFALRAAGVAEGGDEGIDRFRAAVAVTEASPARYEQARSLLALGAALRRAGHRRDARQPLREALDLAHRGGAAALARTAREELVAAGARPRRPALTGRDALTARERRVAEIAAEGLSNREIAQALFVTVRTVEMHLTSAYQKLGISSRGELRTDLETPQT